MLQFGERLRSARLDQNMTQEQLANKIGVTSATISNYETCQKYPSLEVFIRTCEVLKVSSDYMLGLSDDKILLRHGLSDEQFILLQKLIHELEEGNEYRP